MFQSHLAMSSDSQALTPMSYKAGICEVPVNQQMISILENIEPEIVYSGYDNSQPDAPHLLLTSLNRLCEKQLLWIVKWSKSLPGNGSLQLRVTEVVATGTARQASPEVLALNPDLNRRFCDAIKAKHKISDSVQQNEIIQLLSDILSNGTFSKTFGSKIASLTTILLDN